MPRRPNSRYENESIPPDNDPSWRTISQPLLTFLATGKTWEQIDAWRPVRMGENVCRNALIWLELRNYVRDRRVNGVVTWTATMAQVPLASGARLAPDDDQMLMQMTGG